VRKKTSFSNQGERFLHEIVAQRDIHEEQAKGIVGWFYCSYIKETIKFVKKTGGLILDAGCGDGIIFKNEDIKPIQLDISATRLKRAKKYNDLLICGDAYSLPFKDGAFDLVLVVAVLEHTAEPRRILVEAHRVLKLNGFLIVLIPNDLNMTIGRLLLFKWPPRYPDHLTFITPKRLYQWTKEYFSISVSYPLPFRKISFWFNMYYFAIMKKIIHYK
jgi:SAM-dependent methyltransferase